MINKKLKKKIISKIDVYKKYDLAKRIVWINEQCRNRTVSVEDLEDLKPKKRRR